jgi:N-acyl-D-amino-acid deacylase
MNVDLVIENARIVDGTGTPWFKGDVAVKDDKIVVMGVPGKLAKHYSTKKVINAQERYLMPGFIDMHTHSDFVSLSEPEAKNKLCQGVTSQGIGQCGYSAAPIREENLEALHQYSGFLMAGVTPEWTWRSFGQWLDHLGKLNLGTNLASFVGHGTIRIAAMGFDNRQPSRAELEDMKNMVRICMSEGAVGMTTGLIYAPGIYSSAEEISELSKGMTEFSGLYESHMRSESDNMIASVYETIEIGRKAGIPVQISHHKASGVNNWGKVRESLAIVDSARAEGIDVTVNVYPYEACSTTLRAILPGWVQEGGIDKLNDRLKDASTRERLKKEILQPAAGWDNYYLLGGGAQGVILLFFPATPQYEGKTLQEVAEIEKKDPLDAAFDLIINNQGTDTCAYTAMAEEDVNYILCHPASVIVSDSIPSPPGTKAHPRVASSFCRVLDLYVRQKHLLNLETAVHKMTAFPARRMGFYNRGIIAPNMAADMILVDMQRIRDKATFTHTDAVPEGIDMVMVNGCVSIDDGRFTGKYAGTILRH